MRFSSPPRLLPEQRFIDSIHLENIAENTLTQPLETLRANSSSKQSRKSPIDSIDI